ncbi:MAG: hypothetical protein QM479_15275 [Pseudomonadota bacterium]
MVSLDIYAGGFIVNSSASLDSISKKTTRAIYTLRYRRWGNGRDIIIFVLSDSNPLHRAFVKKQLHLFPHHLRKNWDRVLFSGLGQIPIQVKTEQELINSVSSTPNAIAYLSGNIPQNQNIKLLKVKN